MYYDRGDELWRRSNSSWKEIANTWFGAESRTTYQQNGFSETIFDLIFDNQSVIEWYNHMSPINIEAGRGTTVVLSSSGDSSKTISVYKENRVDDLSQSKIGLAINAPWVSAELKSGLSDTGLSVIRHLDGADTSLGLSMDLTKLQIALESVTLVETEEGVQYYTYSRVSVNPLGFAMAYLLTQTGDIANYQMLPEQQGVPIFVH